MGLPRDVDWTSLRCTVWPLEGVKFDFFLDIFMNILKTLRVRCVKFCSGSTSILQKVHHIQSKAILAIFQLTDIGIVSINNIMVSTFKFNTFSLTIYHL